MKNRNLLKVSSATVIFGMLLLASCKEDGQPAPEDKNVKVQVDKHHAVEVNMVITHADKFDILTTTKKIYNLQGIFVKEIEHIDTLPSLGSQSEIFSTGRTRQNSDGEDVDIDTTIIHPVDYQLYITVTKK